MQKIEQQADLTMQAAYRALRMDEHAPLPDATVPRDGLLLNEFFDDELVQRFEKFIAARPNLLPQWRHHKAALTNYIEKFNTNPRNIALDANELKGASYTEIVDFKLVLGMLHLFAEGKRGYLGTIEGAHLFTVPENVYRKDPMVMAIRVGKDTDVLVHVGGTTKEFHLKAGDHHIEILARDEAGKMKPWHGQVEIEVPGEWRIPLESAVSINWTNPIKSATILPAATGNPAMWKRDPMFMEIDSKRNTKVTIVMGNYQKEVALKKGLHPYEIIPPFGAMNIKLWRGYPLLVEQGVAQPIEQFVSVGSWGRLKVPMITP